MERIDGDLGGPSGKKHEEALEGLRGPMTRSKAKMAKEALEQDEDNIVDVRVSLEEDAPKLVQLVQFDEKSNVGHDIH